MSLQNASAYIYALCAHVCALIFRKTFYYLMNLSFKFHKYRGFRRRDICKTILSFKTINFQCILHICTVLLFQSFQRWIISEGLWNFLET